LNSLIYDSPFGLLRIITNENKLISVKLVDAKNEKDDLSSHDEVALETANQLKQYFEKTRIDFDLPISYGNASPFQIAVWESLQRIPYGETVSYSELAHMAGSDKAFRAVGNANRNNPIAIVIPCHRCIAKNGNLHGYFYGLEKKKFLLDLEQIG
jgi:methylated-DNA-[protein]-cysteine S-methyltransferase